MLRCLLACCVFLASACASSPDKTAPTADLAFVHVNVVDVQTGTIRADQTVLIEGQRIKLVAPSRRTAVPTGAHLVDARGKYLIPGLWDMHVHHLHKIQHSNNFRLLIANGITGVRDMGTGMPLADVARIRKRIAQGRQVGPRIVASGRIVDRQPPLIPSVSLGVGNPDEARAAVRRLKNEGADFIKLYDGLARETYLTAADEARAQRIPFAGHFPPSVSAAEASALGQRSMEHLGGVLEAGSSQEHELRRRLEQDYEGPSYVLTRAFAVHSYERRKADALSRMLARNKTWQVPTLVNVRNLALHAQVRARFRGHPQLAYVPKDVRARWMAEKAGPADFLAQFSEQQLELLRQSLALMSKAVERMQHLGVGFLAGTDSDRPFAIPGFSLHEELSLFVDAGFSPVEAVRTATINPARYLGRSNELGTVESGYLADLVLLDRNPLADIRNTTSIRAVVANGRYYSRQKLDAELATVAAQYR